MNTNNQPRNLSTSQNYHKHRYQSSSSNNNNSSVIKNQSPSNNKAITNNSIDLTSMNLMNVSELYK